MSNEGDAHLATWEAENATTPAEIDWTRWIDGVEKALAAADVHPALAQPATEEEVGRWDRGGDAWRADGDSQLDGWSLDGLYDSWKAGVTAEEAAAAALAEHSRPLREEMIEVILEENRQRRAHRPYLTPEREKNLANLDGGLRYLVAEAEALVTDGFERHTGTAGIFLVWDADGINLTEAAYERIVTEADAMFLAPPYRVYSHLNLFVTDDVEWQQISRRL